MKKRRQYRAGKLEITAMIMISIAFIVLLANHFHANLGISSLASSALMLPGIMLAWFYVIRSRRK